jgi:hypothetical protein
MNMAKKPTTAELLSTLINKIDGLEARIDGVDAKAEAPAIAFEAGPLPEEAEDAAHNALVTFVVSGLVQWDGDPSTDGSELYAPADFDVEAHKKANGIDPVNRFPGQLCDGDGNPVVSIAGDSFMCPAITAQELERRGMGRIAWH